MTESQVEVPCVKEALGACSWEQRMEACLLPVASASLREGRESVLQNSGRQLAYKCSQEGKAVPSRRDHQSTPNVH